MNAPNAVAKTVELKLKLVSLHIVTLKSQITALENGEVEIFKTFEKPIALIRSRIEELEELEQSDMSIDP